ncbi:hypothetical protein P152DRAFT_459291 [Eremomyces bilateralis CBS 781.70]|uniref:Exocyst complex protein EXO70 n=1 Tax=Eremomyces bilateralis CBS 781.70 TaxID=1392243 RepID=A0A6G1G1K9_9PEZI|nr:uncharacterized protein P152DRAFT_459291 [Eremomyces bilateralis CBS 781.70]KAF1811810.1 hypothetical protein P152DRAFT_459291 [Eremomyces bilateralis CBS 781.70]
MPDVHRTALAEDSAEVEVLTANIDKLDGLRKKIQGSLNRLETNGKNMEDAIRPVYGNTSGLQTMNGNIDHVIDAIDRIFEPVEGARREERIVKAGPRQVGLPDYIASLERATRSLAELKNSNFQCNQQAMSEIETWLKGGTMQMEDIFRDTLREDARPVEPLHFITKQLPFPKIPQEKVTLLQTINTHIMDSVAQTSTQGKREYPSVKIYTDVRGEYIAISLRNLASASVSTARKTSPDTLYRRGTSGIGTYANCLAGLYVSEYENVYIIFPRDEWIRVFTTTCNSSFSEFNKTLRELNNHIKSNIITDCYLAFEIIEVIQKVSVDLERTTGSAMKVQLSDALKPIRDTAKAAVTMLLEDTRSRAQSLAVLPSDASTIPLTAEVMRRLQSLAGFLEPLTSVMRALGDGGWSASSSSAASSNKAFDVGADGPSLFAHYASDMLDALVGSLEGKAKQMKSRGVAGIFIANNVAVIDRGIRTSELASLLSGLAPKVEMWRKKSVQAYVDAWKECSILLFDVQYTNRAPRPPSTAATVDSAAMIKSMSSRDRDGVKEKFRQFNTSFDDLVSKHKQLKMEREVRSMVQTEITRLIEPMYGRFWDRYHEVDKGKGKHVKYDKQTLTSILQSLG